MSDKLFTKAELDAAVELRTKEAAAICAHCAEDTCLDTAEDAYEAASKLILALLTTSGTVALPGGTPSFTEQASGTCQPSAEASNQDMQDRGYPGDSRRR